MSDNIYKQNVYSYAEEMWHSKGRVGKEKETCVQVCSQMEEVYYVKEEFAATLNGKLQGSGLFMIKRVDGAGHEKIIGNTKDRYELLQPLQYAQLYDEAVGQPCETFGYLGQDAEKIFITHKLPSIDIYGDEIKLYNLLCAGFDGLYGEHQYVTKVRTICQNTQSLAVSDARKTNNQGRGDLYVGRHNNPNHVRDLKAWLSLVQKNAEEVSNITKNLFCKMQDTPITVDEAFGLTKEIYITPNMIPEFYPPELLSEQQEKNDKKLEKAQESRDLVMELFNGAGIAIDKTAYGFYNANTEYLNHHIPSKKDFAYSILVGTRNNTMDKALNVIQDWMKFK